jgi:hypothetical protein
MAKKAKYVAANMLGPSTNQELQQLCNESSSLPWYPKQQSVMEHAVSHVSHVDLKKQQSP